MDSFKLNQQVYALLNIAEILTKKTRKLMMMMMMMMIMMMVIMAILITSQKITMKIMFHFFGWSKRYIFSQYLVVIESFTVSYLIVFHGDQILHVYYFSQIQKFVVCFTHCSCFIQAITFPDANLKNDITSSSNQVVYKNFNQLT